MQVSASLRDLRRKLMQIKSGHAKLYKERMTERKKDRDPLTAQG